MFKSAFIYKIEQWAQPEWAEVTARLEGEHFVACSASQTASMGWVAPRGKKQGALLESVAQQWILKLCTETKAVPASAIKVRLDEQLDLIEKQTGRRPKGQQTKEVKEDVVNELLPRAFPKRSATLVWVAPGAGLVWVGTASTTKADAVVTRLIDVLGGGLMLKQVQTQHSPTMAMAEWLTSREAPSGFSVDRECELKQPDSEKAAVRYARHTLDIDEVGEHVKQGKLPTQLALTWRGRVSFVLTDTLALKKIKLLDVVLEGASVTQSADDGFDADVALTAGELGPLVADLIDALGGLSAGQAPGALATIAAPVGEVVLALA
jgi:recombination associated protein RdgC